MSQVTRIRLVAALLALVGAWILWNSTAWGISAFDSIVRRSGGSLAGYEVELAYAGSVAALRTMGAVLMGVGLLRALGPSLGELA